MPFGTNFNGARLVRLRKGRQASSGLLQTQRAGTLCRQTGRTTRYSSLSKTSRFFVVSSEPARVVSGGGVWYNEGEQGETC